MSAAEIVDQIRSLPPDERRAIVERLWEEFGEFDDNLSEEQTVELDRRSEEALQHPERSVPWEQVHAEVLKRLGK